MTASPYLAPFVRSFFEDHLICRRNVSRHTIQSYRDAVKLLLGFAAERRKKAATKLLVADVTEEDVLAYLSHLEATRGNSVQTRNLRLVAVRSLFNYVAAREPLLLDHCHRIATIPRKRGAVLPEVRYLEREQVTALLDAVDKGSPRGRHDHALLLFMYNTGARVQEVADVGIAWLTLSEPYKVDLLGKGRKWRTCPLWQSTADHLRGLIQQRGSSRPDEHLFVNRYGRPLSRSGIADIIRRHVGKASETCPSLRGKTVTPHTLRHTTAMHLLQSGVEVNVIRGWLGHVSISTTNRYIEIDLAMKAKALQACEVSSPTSGGATGSRGPDILAWLESL
jgi:integrase/recombinase XerD